MVFVWEIPFSNKGKEIIEKIKKNKIGILCVWNHCVFREWSTTYNLTIYVRRKMCCTFGSCHCFDIFSTSYHVTIEKPFSYFYSLQSSWILKRRRFKKKKNTERNFRAKQCSKQWFSHCACCCNGCGCCIYFR